MIPRESSCTYKQITHIRVINLIYYQIIYFYYLSLFTFSEIIVKSHIPIQIIYNFLLQSKCIYNFLIVNKWIKLRKFRSNPRKTWSSAIIQLKKVYYKIIYYFPIFHIPIQIYNFIYNFLVVNKWIKMRKFRHNRYILEKHEEALQ